MAAVLTNEDFCHFALAQVNEAMARLPSLTALRAFEAVARHMSFTKAADELCVTVPALSHHVKALELELGSPLFTRSHRSIELTEKGRSLAADATDAFARLSDSWSKLNANPKIIKLATGVHFMTNWLVPRATRLRNAIMPHDIDHITTFDLLNFEAREVDLAIQNGDHDVPGLETATLYVEWWTPMTSPELAATLTRPADILDLPGIETRHPREPKGHPSLDDWLRACGLNEVHPDTRNVVHTETGMQMAANSEGIKLCASLQAAELHRQGRLVAPFPIAIRRQGIRFFTICRPGEMATDPIKSIRDFMIAEFEEMDRALGLQDMKIVELPEQKR